MNSILIVDDNPDDREYLSRSLQHNTVIGHDVVEAHDETSCLEILQSGRKIDCILLDYSLPGQDGLKVLSHILDQDPYASVVMVSGQRSESVAVEALKRGALDYFVKSAFPPSEMEKSVLDAISRTAIARRIDDQRESLRTFADVMVHDVQTPWRDVLGGLERLARDLPPEVARRHEADLETIRKGAEQVDGLVTALRDFGSGDGDEIKLEKVDLNVQVEMVRAAMRSDLQAVNGQVICPEPLPVVIGNGPQIAQLLKNLVRHGIRHNRSDEPTVRITARADGQGWAIDLADNGIGIDPDLQGHAFDPFQRLGPDGGYGGSGLRLAAARRIAERLGYTLDCASGPDEGTTFTLAVPAERSVADAPDRDSTEGALRSQSRWFGMGRPEVD